MYRTTLRTDGQQRLAEDVRLSEVGALMLWRRGGPSNRMPLSVPVEFTKWRAHRTYIDSYPTTLGLRPSEPTSVECTDGTKFTARWHCRARHVPGTGGWSCPSRERSKLLAGYLLAFGRCCICM